MAIVSVIIPARNERFLAPTVADLLAKATGCVYLVTNTLNGKQYVGQTCRGMKQRWIGHCRDAKRGITTAIASAIRKYGADAFAVEQIAVGYSPAHLSFLESIHIHSYGTVRPRGYNLVSGSDLRIVHAETKAKISAAKKGCKAWNLGRPHSVATREAISNAAKGRPSHRKGVRLTDAQREQMSRIRRGKPAGKRGPMSDETKAKLSAARTGKPGVPHTAEWKARLSERNKGNNYGCAPKSREHRAAISRSASIRQRAANGTWVAR